MKLGWKDRARLFHRVKGATCEPNPIEQALEIARKARADLGGFARALLPRPSETPLDEASAPEGSWNPGRVADGDSSPLSSVGHAPRRLSGGEIKRFLRELEKEYDVYQDGEISLDAVFGPDGKTALGCVLTIPVRIVPIGLAGQAVAART